MANPYFNAVYYLQQNPDVFSAGYTVATAWDHYVKFGANEANVIGGTFRSPNPWFDVKYYLANNPDLVRAGITPATALDHFLTFGSTAGEDRAPNATIAAAPITEAKLLAYALANADLQAAFGISASATSLTAAQQTSLLNHFYAYGYNEGRADAPASVTIPDADPGKTFALTTGADNIIGTSGDDVVTGVNNATATTFSAIDSIDGAGGFDTLKLELNNSYTGGASIKNIETISVVSTNVAGINFNANAVAGLKNVEVNAGNGVTFQNLGNAVDAKISNTAAATTLQFTDAAVAGATDKVTVTLDNVTGGAAVNVNSVTALSAGIEEVGFVTVGTNSNVTLSSNDGTVSKVTASGDKNLTLALTDAPNNTGRTATTIDASAMKGNFLLSGLGAANHTVTGGAGNDTIDFGVNFNANDTVDGGEGTDTLAITSSAAQTAITAAQWAKVKNVETVRFTSDNVNQIAQDASILTGVNTLGVVATAGADTYAFSNLGADSTVNVTGQGNAVTALNLSLKDATGLSDSVKVNLGTATESNAAGVTVTTLGNIAGVETVNVVSLGATSTTVNTITTSNVSGKLVLTGDASLTIGTIANSTQIDAAGLKGILNIGGGAAYAVVGGNIQSGSGNDIIVAGAGAQTINGGAGNDTITGGAGADILTGGAGVDTYGSAGNFAAVGESVVATAETLTGNIANGQTLTFGNGVDIITDFVSGTDKLDVATAATVATSGIGLAANTVLANGTTYTLLGTYNSATNVFTVDSTATASTANVATLVAVGDGVVTFENSTGYVLLTGVSALAAADFI